MWQKNKIKNQIDFLKTKTAVVYGNSILKMKTIIKVKNLLIIM